jgi:hypothetical protein
LQFGGAEKRPSAITLQNSSTFFSAALRPIQQQFTQPLVCTTLHPDRCVWRLLLYIPDVLCIPYIRDVHPGMGRRPPAW